MLLLWEVLLYPITQSQWSMVCVLRSRPGIIRCCDYTWGLPPMQKYGCINQWDFTWKKWICWYDLLMIIVEYQGFRILLLFIRTWVSDIFQQWADRSVALDLSLKKQNGGFWDSSFLHMSCTKIEKAFLFLRLLI